MGQLNLSVDNMSCRRCVRRVTALVRDVPGVETVSANAADGTVQLSGSMQLADVLAAFAGTTYQPHLDDTRPDVTGDAVEDDSDETATSKPAP